MLNVTDQAAAALNEALEANRGDDSDVLRLTQSPEGMGLTLDKEHDGDQVVTHDERKVLVIESDVSQALDGATIDIAESPEGQRLILKPAEGQ